MRSKKRGLFLFLLCWCFFPSALFAEVVKDVGVDGTLTLESGKRVVLAGILMDTEGVSVLRVLVQKQDVKLKLITHSVLNAKESAYVYLKAKCVKFPVAVNNIPAGHEILINEFLVKTGAAKVAEDQDFSHKAKFLKVQEEARRKGEGVWSYEAP